MALDLADDVRRRVRRQLDAAVDVEAVDRLDQADAADLDEVVELLAAIGVAPRERAHEREVLLDQLLARGEVALLVVAAEQRLVGNARHALGPHERVALAQLDPAAAVPVAQRDAVHRRLEQAAQADPVARLLLRAGGRLLRERADAGLDRVVGDAQDDADLAFVGVVVLEQGVEGELEVVQHVERDVVPGGDAPRPRGRPRPRTGAPAGSES